MTDHSPLPWRLDYEPSGSVRIVCANGGVVALLKAAGGRKLANGQAIVAWANSGGLEEAVQARDYYAGLYAERCGQLLEAQAIEARQRQDAKTGLARKGESAVPTGCAPDQS